MRARKIPSCAGVGAAPHPLVREAGRSSFSAGPGSEMVAEVGQSR